jgi:hypothetical protein
MDNQQIHITNVQKNEGCLSGCGTIFAVALLAGIAIEYWYVSVGLAVLAVAAGIYWYKIRKQPALPSTPGTSAIQEPDTTTTGSRTCHDCGSKHAGTGFCPDCGAAQHSVCSGCGRTGLQSPYCPECGAATYRPPTPG